MRHGERVKGLESEVKGDRVKGLKYEAWRESEGSGM